MSPPLSDELRRPIVVARVCCNVLAFIATTVGGFALARLAGRDSVADFDRWMYFVAGAIWAPVPVYLITAELLRRWIPSAVAVALGFSTAQVAMGLFFIAWHVKSFRELRPEMTVAIAAVVMMAPRTYLVWRSFLQIRAGGEPVAVAGEGAVQQPA